MITLYDLPANAESKAYNFNVWKARYTLNYKRIPYKTVWVEFPDIEMICKQIGAEPTGKKPDGSPFYTVPFIYDDSTSTSVSDSLKIAEYLDKTYPDTPTVIAPGTRALTAAFVEAFMSKQSSLSPLLIPHAVALMNPPSAGYMRPIQELQLGKLEDLLAWSDEKKVAEWKKLEDSWGSVDAWMDKETTLFMGDVPCFADFVVGGVLVCMRRVFGSESDEWKRILGWHGGRWARLVEKLEKYETIV